MVANYGRGEPHVNLNMIGAEVVPVEVEKKADARAELFYELDKLGIKYKKNMSKAKLEELLG